MFNTKSHVLCIYIYVYIYNGFEAAVDAIIWHLYVYFMHKIPRKN